MCSFCVLTGVSYKGRIMPDFSSYLAEGTLIRAGNRGFKIPFNFLLNEIKS